MDNVSPILYSLLLGNINYKKKRKKTQSKPNIGHFVQELHQYGTTVRDIKTKRQRCPLFWKKKKKKYFFTLHINLFVGVIVSLNNRRYLILQLSRQRLPYLTRSLTHVALDTQSKSERTVSGVSNLRGPFFQQAAVVIMSLPGFSRLFRNTLKTQLIPAANVASKPAKHNITAGVSSSSLS